MLKYTRPLQLNILVRGEVNVFDGIIHYLDSVFILELEPVTAAGAYLFVEFYQVVRSMLFQLQQAKTLGLNRRFKEVKKNRVG